VIGSSPKCEIYLFKDSQVAAKHAAISNRNGNFVITSIDGASIFVNNASVRQQRLRTGDQIKIGNTLFIFDAKALKNSEH
jgi:predicted component of type VI protein secretion system